jgi:hypothetical protein
MVVEHQFITTLEAADALRLASQFLAERGFEARAQGAFALGGGDAWNVLEMARGKKNPRRAKSVVEYPQMLRMEWDRGRVTVAVSSTSYQESRSDYFGRRTTGKAAQWQQQALLAVATHLQQLLEARADSAAVVASLAAQENELHELHRRRQRRSMWTTVIVLVVIFGGVIALIAVLANMK